MATLQKPKQFTLYHTSDARSFRVLLCFCEMGMEDALNLITMHFPPRVFHRQYLKVNMLGTIPYMIDSNGDVRMTESCGIPQAYNPTTVTSSPRA